LYRLRKPWGIALVFVALMILGALWWLSFNNWDLATLLPRENIAKLSFGADSVDFSGEYKIRGPGYAGTMTITRAGEGYHVKCALDDSVVIYGNGLAMGEVLGVVYDLNGAKHTRLAAYTKDSASITGLVARMNDDKLRVEKTPNAAKLSTSVHPLVGNYRVEGSHPNGQSYAGKMAFERTGSTYGVQAWISDSTGTYGTGFTVDDVLVTGYANSMGVGLAVYEIKSASIQGRWMYTDYERIPTANDIRAGTEKLIK